MKTQTVPDLVEKFKQAAEIASQVPEQMREAAFNRALDLLTGAIGASSPPSNLMKHKSRPEKIGKRAVPPPADVDTGNVAELLLSAIDSTNHPGVMSATKVLDKALMILQIARQNHGVDGLTPATISRLLTEKFRIRTSDAAVRMALGKSADLVNRLSEGKGFIYQIMAPGETYLAHVAGGQAQVKPSKRNQSKKKTEARPASKKKSKKSSDSVVDKSPAKKNQGKLGLKSEIIALQSSGFFKEAKTPAQIHDYLKRKRGHKFGVPQISIALLRMVRDSLLERDENEDGQYEYRSS